jgi:hypothetical protein
VTDDKAGPRNFASTLAELSGGDFNTDLGAEQQKLLSTLQDQALEAGKDSTCIAAPSCSVSGRA